MAPTRYRGVLKASPNTQEGRDAGFAAVTDAAIVMEAKSIGHCAVAIQSASHAEALAAVKCAREQNMRVRVRLSGALGNSASDMFQTQLQAAELADAGAEAIVLAAGAGSGSDELEELLDVLGEVDVSGGAT